MTADGVEGPSPSPLEHLEIPRWFPQRALSYLSRKSPLSLLSSSPSLRSRTWRSPTSRWSSLPIASRAPATIRASSPPMRTTNDALSNCSSTSWLPLVSPVTRDHPFPTTLPQRPTALLVSSAAVTASPLNKFCSSRSSGWLLVWMFHRRRASSSKNREGWVVIVTRSSVSGDEGGACRGGCSHHQSNNLISKHPLV
jgi:hypothetical protein